MKVIEDLSYVVLLRKKFSYIESIPGVLLPHPSSSPFPFKADGGYNATTPDHAWRFQGSLIAPQHHELYDQYHHQFTQFPLKITPSMSSLEALLSKLPSVVPPPPAPAQPAMPHHHHHHHNQAFQRADLEFIGIEKVAKDEAEDECYRPERDAGETSSSMSYGRHSIGFGHAHQHQDHNLASASRPASSGF